MSIRTDRIASLIREELGTMLSREFSGSAEFGFATVTEVRVTPDLRLARVFVSVLGSQEKQERTMERIQVQRKHYRSELGRRINLRFAPDVEFRHDKSLDNAMHIESLLRQVRKEEKKDDAAEE